MIREKNWVVNSSLFFLVGSIVMTFCGYIFFLFFTNRLQHAINGLCLWIWMCVYDKECILSSNLIHKHKQRKRNNTFRLISSAGTSEKRQNASLFPFLITAFLRYCPCKLKTGLNIRNFVSRKENSSDLDAMAHSTVHLRACWYMCVCVI